MSNTDEGKAFSSKNSGLIEVGNVEDQNGQGESAELEQTFG